MCCVLFLFPGHGDPLKFLCTNKEEIFNHNGRSHHSTKLMCTNSVTDLLNLNQTSSNTVSLPRIHSCHIICPLKTNLRRNRKHITPTIILEYRRYRQPFLRRMDCHHRKIFRIPTHPFWQPWRLYQLTTFQLSTSKKRTMRVPWMVNKWYMSQGTDRRYYTTLRMRRRWVNKFLFKKRSLHPTPQFRWLYPQHWATPWLARMPDKLQCCCTRSTSTKYRLLFR